MDSKLLPLSFLGTVPSNPQLPPNYPKPPVKRNGFGTVYRTTQPLFPIGTIRKIVKPSWEGHFKNGTRSVPTTLDLRCRLTHPGSEDFPRIMGLPPRTPLFPIGTIRKIVKPSWEGYFKNGTRSVLTTLDLRCRLTHPGSEDFPRIMGLPPRTPLFPIGTMRKIVKPSWEGHFKNGTRSVLTTLDLRCRLTHPGSEDFPRIMGLPPHARLFPIILPGCIICPSLARRARKDIIPKRRNFTRQVRSAKIRQTTIS